MSKFKTASAMLQEWEESSKRMQTEAKIRADERKKVLDEYDLMFQELSNIKSHCGEWYEKTEQKIRENVLNEAIEKVDEYWLDDAYLVSCIKGDLEQMKGEQT